MKTAAILPTGSGREENLTRVVTSLVEGSVKPDLVVIVLDGPEAKIGDDLPAVAKHLPHVIVTQLAEKHQPGMPQPRNVGAHKALAKAEELGIELDFFWFLDSDCVVSRDCLLEYQRANVAAATEDAPSKYVGQRILIGRYDWLAQGAESPQEGLEMVDPRAQSFESRTPAQTFKSDLSAGLACFSGNLMWPVKAFMRVGGFWNEIHHGRCEDGELGLRAVQMGIPIAFVAKAHAMHRWHHRDFNAILERNRRDVPMLNERHPWVESRCTCTHQKTMHGSEEGEERHSGACKDCKCAKYEQALFVVEEDGRRFNARCKCGWSGNTAEIWDHESRCPIKATIS